MKRILLSLSILMGYCSFGVAQSSPDADPNFYIYLCFGQSNMEGNAAAESVDKSNIDSRFQMLATCNFSSPSRTLGKWYKATPPIVSPDGKLGPTDYFGRTMVAALPGNVKVGVVAVAMGGSPIEMFDKDKYQQKMKDNPSEWWVTLANRHYGGNPYGRLIDMGKEAQKVGIIKGILLPQGCSNNGDPNWPNMVKKIYKDMLNDLGLSADSVPLFAGETLRQENGGSCYAHNTQVNRLPQVIPTSHVISSAGCPGNGQDPWHFNAKGYRIMGKRYAYSALKVMGRETRVDSAYVMVSTLKNFFTPTSFDTEYKYKKDGKTRDMQLWGTFADKHRELLTDETTFSSEDFKITSKGKLTASDEKDGIVTAQYTDFMGTEHNIAIHVLVYTAGINDIESDEAAATTIYTLDGRRIDNTQQRLRPGIYISNGKKIIVKP